METLLIVGTGDIANRALPALVARYRVHALTRDHYQADRLAQAGAGAILGDLDDPTSLAPLGGLAERVVHLAPPPDRGVADPRTRNLLDALERGAMLAQAKPLARLVYVSTTGVYGDCRGDWIDETRAVNPQTDRARRRVDAEQSITNFARRRGVSHAILRVPGIYAGDRLPLERLRKGVVALRPEEDVYTNHIHAEDLAAIVTAAIECDGATGVINVADDSALKMGDYFDLVAERCGLPRPPRVSRAEAQARLSPMLYSFMSESRRVRNAKMKRALGVTLRYPTVREGVPFDE